ncbi:MAG: hypothetical protein HY644_04530 [Acidobacteria bacterium]|nr:hypothetical protein [Acidobacteriota bacterium]
MSQYNSAGFKPSINASDHYLVYPPYYCHVLWLDVQKPIRYDVPPQLESCFGFWTQFCVHEYLTLALEHLLAAVLDVAGSESTGVPVKSIYEAFAGPDFKSTLEPIFGDVTRPYLLLRRLKTVTVPTTLACLEAQKTLGATSKRSEWSLVDLADGAPQVSAAVAAAILSVLFAKWRNAPNQCSGYINSNAGPNLHAGTVLPQLDSWLDPKLSWPVAFRRLIEPFVLEQHDRIMYEKGKLESCWLHRTEGRILKDQDYKPDFRSSRHWNCVRIMKDIGLLNIDNKGAVSITKEGRQALSRVLKDDAIR